MTNYPTISIIVLNFNGKHHLEGFFESALKLDYPKDKLEIIFVDNGSKDGSLKLVRNNYPGVKIIANKENLGFAPANNVAAKAATGEYLVFFNNDIWMESDWLKECLKCFEFGTDIGCVTSRILNNTGTSIDYAGGGANFQGIGFNVGRGEKDILKYSEKVETLFPSGAAMMIPTDLFLEIGGFDEDFFAYYEDIDIGWRLWIFGYKVIYCPKATAYHHHSATSNRIDISKLRVLHIRNPLYMIFKNYESENLHKVLPATLLLSINRTLLLAPFDYNLFRIENNTELTEITDCNGYRKFKKFVKKVLKKVYLILLKFLSKVIGYRLGVAFYEPLNSIAIPKVALADLVAYKDFMANFDKFLKKREFIQGNRKRPDKDIMPLFQEPFWFVERSEDYRRLQEFLKEFFELEAIFKVSIDNIQKTEEC